MVYFSTVYSALSDCGTTVTDSSSPAQDSVKVMKTVEAATSSVRPSEREPNLQSATPGGLMVIWAPAWYLHFTGTLGKVQLIYLCFSISLWGYSSPYDLIIYMKS